MSRRRPHGRTPAVYPCCLSSCTRVVLGTAAVLMGRRSCPRVRRFPTVDKSKLAMVGHGVGAIAALYTGLGMQVPRGYPGARNVCCWR